MKIPMLHVKCMKDMYMKDEKQNNDIMHGMEQKYTYKLFCQT